MSERIEKIIKEYHRMKKERNCLEHQIRNFKGISEKEMIDSMNFHSPEGERVQTSNISNVPLRIVELLDNGYVEKVNRKLRREMDESVKEYGYLCWKIEVVETAMRERMDQRERAIFERMFARGKSYRQVCKAYKRGTLHNNQLYILRRRCLQALADHLKNLSSFPVYSQYMKQLQKEFQGEGGDQE